jgi:Cu/Ag efflux pump CusA
MPERDLDRECVVRATVGGPSGQPVQVRVFGDNLDELTRVSMQAERALTQLPTLAR